MAELKLSTVWKISDFAQRTASAQNGQMCKFESGELTELRHNSLPGVQWQAQLYTSSPKETDCKKGFAAFYLAARFGVASSDTKYVWADYTATLLDGAGRDLVKDHPGFEAAEFIAQTNEGLSELYGQNNSFRSEHVSKAVSGGVLCIRIDLSVVNVGEFLRCRELVRDLLTNSYARPDFDVMVGEESFGLHKSILAKSSTVFAAMFESEMKEAAADSVLTLPDTTPAAFKAFKHAIYYDSWDFLSDVDLAQAVLYLADKYRVCNLKRLCDASLAEKINEANALEILIGCAAQCNVEKTKAACIDILAKHMAFKDSETWLDFKKRFLGVASEILNTISDKWIDAHKEPTSKPAALRAFTQAVYFDNCDFVCDVDLTQDVLRLAAKHNVADLQLRCDEALAARVNEANALEILTKCAVLCNAAKTQAVCIDVLAQHPEFNESQVWLDFKKRNPEQAFEICGIVMHKMRVAFDSLKSQYEAASSVLKRKCEETEETTNCKRHKE